MNINTIKKAAARHAKARIELEQAIIAANANNVPKRQLAAASGLSRQTVYNIIKKAETTMDKLDTLTAYLDRENIRYTTELNTDSQHETGRYIAAYADNGNTCYINVNAKGLYYFETETPEGELLTWGETEHLTSIHSALNYTP